jgi:hypothetical protein
MKGGERMCDPGLDGDMYDHSTESGNWVFPGGTVDPIRSDPRFPKMAKQYGQERAAELLTVGDSPSVKDYAMRLFRKF